MGMLANLLGPALGVGLLLSGLFATPASALELAMGGTFYVSVLEGDCPQPIDLWGVGPGRNPLFLGHYQGHVSKRPPIFMGSYKSGQELYIWHETNDPGTGERRSQDIKSADAYKVTVDPRGGYLIELKGKADTGLKMWVYPGKPPVAVPTAADDKAQVGGTLGSVVVNGPAETPKQATAALEPPRAPKQADTTGNWQWPILQAAIAGLLYASYKRSRQLALAAAEVGPVSIGQVDVQSFGRHDEHTHSFQATAPAAAPVVVPAPTAAVTDDPAVAFSGPTTAPVKAAPEPADWADQPAAQVRGDAPASPARKAGPPMAPHFAARAPEGWAPLPSEGATAATHETPAMKDKGTTPAHAPVHGSVRAVARPAPAKPVETAAPAGLLEQLGRHRSMGLPLAFIGTRPVPKPAQPTDLGAVSSIKRALSTGFHDLDLLHADEEILVLSGLDLSQRRRVSIHALTPALARDEKLAAQFVRDAQGFAALAHKGLLKIHRVSADPIPHYVAEPLPGQLVASALQAGQPLPLHEVLGAGAFLTEVLDHLHQRGMIHGDVRPSRIAGLAAEIRLCPPVLCAVGAERRAYRPPESAAGAGSDYRGDLYSVGMLLHHTITGALPPPAKADEHAVEQFKYRAGVPENLVSLIRRCLHADPARRYQDSGMVRQMLETLFREHAVRDRVVLASLPGLARVVRTTLQPIGALTAGLKDRTADEVAQAVLEPRFRDTVKAKLTAKDGMPAIAMLLERAHGLRRWTQETSLVQRVEKLGRMALELAGLHTLIESGGPRHPSVTERLKGEVVKLGEDIAAFEAAVQTEITARLVDFAGVVNDAVGLCAGTSVDRQGVPIGLRGLFAEPATVRLQLVNALATAFAASTASGATRIEVGGTYDEGFKRVVLLVADDGHAVPATVMRPPTAIVPRLTRSAGPNERAAVRDLEHTYEAIERLGGRVMVSNRDGVPGVELRIELPSNLC